MNTLLQKSLKAAENVLPQDGQARLATIVDAFTANYQQNPKEIFSETELKEMEAMDKEGFVKGDQQKVEALFSRHGV